jgi:Flp pilus assembly pilin Flp
MSPPYLAGKGAGVSPKPKGTQAKMDQIRRLYARVDQFARGQTMAEYALLLAAIAVVVYAGYQATGTTVSTLMSNVDGKL